MKTKAWGHHERQLIVLKLKYMNGTSKCVNNHG